jgi:transcriptional regulator with XRE-family HTH domain
MLIFTSFVERQNMLSYSSKSQSALPIGRKIERIRVSLGIKQSALGVALGISQQAVSAIERKEAIDDILLARICLVLGIEPETVKQFNHHRAIEGNYDAGFPDDPGTIGPQDADQAIDAVDKIIELYHRLLRCEREKIEILIQFNK